MGPVHLALLARERAQPQIGFCRGPRTQPRHQGAEVIGGARVAAFAHHGVEPRGAQRGVLGQRLDHERPVRLDHRGPHDLLHHRHAGLGEHPAHGGVMHAQLAWRWFRPASARCDAGAGSRLRAHARSSPAPSLTVPRVADPAARRAAAHARRHCSARRRTVRWAAECVHARSAADASRGCVRRFNRGDVGMGPLGRGLGRAVATVTEPALGREP